MAAGRGTRMGADLPKQFLRLGGIAVLHRTILKFKEAIPDIKVITVLPPNGEYNSYWGNYCAEQGFLCTQRIVNGGITRFHSVKSALSVVPDGAIVAIHDGVRPMLSTKMISRMFAHFENPDVRGLIPVVPIVDTLKNLQRETDANGETMLSEMEGPGPDRSLIYAVQTPQIFCSEDIKAAYGQAYSTDFTDDSSVASKYKIPLSFCEGERLNIKITSPDDLVLAEAVLSNGRL